MVEDKFKRNDFPFGHKCKFPTEFEFKFRKQKHVKFGLNLKQGSNLLRKIP
jgi:hypothetical protein